MAVHKHKVIVTGAAGFIGSHLCKALIDNDNFYVIGIDNLKPSYHGHWGKERLKNIKEAENFEFQEIDLAEVKTKQLVNLFGDSYSVVHLAAWPGVRSSQKYPHEFSKSNLTAFVNILEAVRITKPRQFLFASSSSIYGDLGSNGPVTESLATGDNLKSYYAATKWANEILAASHANISGVSTAALRFFTVYGEFGRPDMAYWGFLKNLLEKKPVELYGVSGGSRNYTYIDDAIQILLRLIAKDFIGFTALNIANNTPNSTLEFLKILANHAQVEPIISVVSRPTADVEKTWADLSKIHSMIGQVDETPIEVGLLRFYNWYISQGIN